MLFTVCKDLSVYQRFWNALVNCLKYNVQLGSIAKKKKKSDWPETQTATIRLVKKCRVYSLPAVPLIPCTDMTVKTAWRMIQTTLTTWKDFVTETIRRHPEEIYFALMLWQQSCKTWPDFWCWTILLYLPCSHKVMLTCVANRLKRMHWFWLEGRAAATHADGLMPCRESRLVEVGYESLCQQQGRGGVRSNEERHFCFTLLPSVTYERIESCDESTPCTLPVPTLYCGHTLAHTVRETSCLLWERPSHPPYVTSYLASWLEVQKFTPHLKYFGCTNRWLVCQ